MKKVIFTERAPAPIGPYSQAVEANGMLYVSGQIPIDPATGQLITSDIESETRCVLENVKAILEACNLTLDDVVKSSIFITDMNNFAGSMPYMQSISPAIIRLQGRLFRWQHCRGRSISRYQLSQ